MSIFISYGRDGKRYIQAKHRSAEYGEMVEITPAYAKYLEFANIIADGIGEAFREAFQQQMIDEIHDRCKKENVSLDERYVVRVGYEEFEYGPRESTSYETLEEMIIDIVHNEWAMSAFKKDLKSGKSIKTTIVDYYRDHIESGDVHCCFIRTNAEHEKIQREERREELERTASQIAQKHNVKVGSLQFIAAVHEELESISYESEQWNSGEARAERYAACSFAGCRDTFWEDNDYVNGQYSSRNDDLYSVLDWLGEECPLLMAKYNEQKLAEEIA